jgi:hypothetical protein
MENQDRYDTVVAKLQEEERRLMCDLRRNEALIPHLNKKGTINLQPDPKIIKYFQDERDPNNFSLYLSQRRESPQSIESAIIQCSQFSTYAKSKESNLKDYSGKDVFHQILTK